MSDNVISDLLVAEVIKVYDGNSSLRRRIFRVISVPRQATTEQVLTLALRAFHITKDPGTRLQTISHLARSIRLSIFV
jgi:hypothetical protein